MDENDIYVGGIPQEGIISTQRTGQIGGDQTGV
jgi:hypothetical protein